MKLITKDHIKRINKILGESAPKTLVKSLETFVALLRNHNEATNIDVELYLKDYSKLQLKMQRIQANTLTIQFVQ